MIEKLAELNRILFTVRELADADGVAVIADVIEQCKRTVIEARIPNHESSISFGELLGLLKTSRAMVSLTGEGMAFIELNPQRLYDLSEAQKRLLLRTCYLHGALRKEARRVLSEFSQTLGGENLRWSTYDSAPLPEGWTPEHLHELGLLERREDGWEVAEEYTSTAAVFLDEGEGWSEEKFKAYLKEKEDVGRLGEDLVRDFEISRLTRMGHVVEARCVRRISNLRVNAGYDIESFDSASVGLNYDRFIEVKSARGAEMHFFWSQNEIQVATGCGERYWIYFQGGIDLVKGLARNEPIMLQNPVKSILGDGKFKTTPHGLIVESKTRGKKSGTH